MTKALETQRRQMWEGMKALTDRATAERRNLSAEEERQFEAMNGDLDRLDERVKILADGERRSRDAEDALAALRGQPVQWRAAGADSETRELDAAFRHVIASNSRTPIVVNPAERRSGWSPGIERRALSTSSGSGLLGVSFYNRILAHFVDTAAILSAGATVVQSQTGEPLKVPKSSAFSTAAIVTEGAAIGASDSTLGSVQLDSYKYGFLVQVSHELVNDEGFDLVGFLAQQAGTAVGNAFGAHAITGTGTAQPLGVMNAAALGVTGGAGVTGAFTADNLIDLYHSLAEPYARSAGAAWLMKNSSLGAVRKLKDSQNRYLFDVNAPAGTGASGTLLGRPVYADPSMPAVALSAKSVAFGDFTRYWVRAVEGFRFEQSLDYAFNSDQITFRCLARLDGDLIDTTGAIKYFAGNAA